MIKDAKQYEISKNLIIKLSEAIGKAASSEGEPIKKGLVILSMQNHKDGIEKEIKEYEGRKETTIRRKSKKSTLQP